jgi:IclR family KDG regulon transcriptional repressor
MRTVKSAERTLALFELFSECQSALTIGQMAKQLGIPQPSVSMLVRNLSDLGYLEHDPVGRTYIPSIRIVVLGSWIERRFKETQSLVRRLDTLQRRVKETTYIGIQSGIYAQYVVVERASKPDLLEINSGNKTHLTLCAFGRALLALKSDTEAAALINRCNAEVNEDRLKLKRADYQRMLADTRRNGYAKTVDAGRRKRGVGAIAMTFKLPSSSTMLAVGVSAAVPDLERKSAFIVESLRGFKKTFIE